MNIKWNAENYSENFSFVHKYGQDVIELLDFSDGMTIIDLGCGNGALTAVLSERGAAVTGMDTSEEMLSAARRTHPDLKFIRGDAVGFTLGAPCDAVFSNAVFHWIDREEQPEMLRHIYAALNPGGQLVFEFGGYGCCEKIHSALKIAFAERGRDYTVPTYFPTIGEYSRLLEECGFKVKFMTLFDRPTRLRGSVTDWIEMFVKKPFEGIAAEEKKLIVARAEALSRDTLSHNGVWYADYVRIRGKAVRPR